MTSMFEVSLKIDFVNEKNPNKLNVSSRKSLCGLTCLSETTLNEHALLPVPQNKGSINRFHGNPFLRVRSNIHQYKKCLRNPVPYEEKSTNDNERDFVMPHDTRHLKCLMSHWCAKDTRY